MKYTLFAVFAIVLRGISLNAQIPFDPTDGDYLFKNYPGESLERNDLPVLLLDSAYGEGWGEAGNGYQMLYQFYSKNSFNAKDLNTRELVKQVVFYTTPPSTSYSDKVTEYDQEDRVILKVTSYLDEDGILVHADKEENTYTGTGVKNYTNLIYNKSAPGGDWVEAARNTYAGGDTFDIETREVWMNSVNSFVPTIRNTNFYTSAGVLIKHQTETIEDNAWVVAGYEDYVYDQNGRLIRIVYYSYYPGHPLGYSSKKEYLYDIQGRDSLFTEYYWYSSWVPDNAKASIYNTSGELVEEQLFQYDGNGGLIISGRNLFTAGPGIYSATPEERLYQSWNSSDMQFLDATLETNYFSELPNGQVFQEFEDSGKSIAGQGNWERSLFGHFFYNKSQLSDTPTPATAQPCTVPNPYSAGFHVQCDQLKTEASYMLWVYDMAGKAVYAKHFKGGEGWSIDRQLNAGTYVAVITQNDRRVASYQLVTGRQ